MGQLLGQAFLMRLTLVILVIILGQPGLLFSKSKERIAPVEAESRPFKISGVNVRPRIFNPTKGEKVTISYRLSRPAKSIIRIFDSQAYLIRELAVHDFHSLGKAEVVWDGKDFRKNIVPDEAYFFTIEAFDLEKYIVSYDPTKLSGGQVFDITVQSDHQRGIISYNLVQDARIRILAGISNGGPLLKTILNWVPKLAGRYEEPWDGKDESGHIEVINQPGFRLSAQIISLPENSIIAQGNRHYTYFQYIKEVVPHRPQKVSKGLPFSSKAEGLRVPLRIPAFGSLKPIFSLEYPQNIKKTKEGLPIVKGSLPLVIRLAEKLKSYIIEQRFEIICFVDFKFIKEVEEGYSPCTWLWDTTRFPNGEHIVTVNLATLDGQVASASLKVFVQN